MKVQTNVSITPPKDKLLPCYRLRYAKGGINVLIADKLYAILKDKQEEIFYADFERIGKNKDKYMLFPASKKNQKGILGIFEYTSKEGYIEVAENTCDIIYQIDNGKTIKIMAIFQVNEYVVFNDKMVFKNDGMQIINKRFDNFDQVDEYCSRQITI
jgi:hypothetical protein